MAGEEAFPLSNHRDPIKSSVHNAAASRRRQHAITVAKDRREALIRTKRLCRDGILDNDIALEGDMVIEEGKAALETQISETVKGLKSALYYQGKGATQKTVEILRALRRLLSKSEIPPIEAAIQAGAVPALVQCLSFGSADEQAFSQTKKDFVFQTSKIQRKTIRGLGRRMHTLELVSIAAASQLLEAAWCLTNIATGEPEETKALLPALPLLIAHLGEKSSLPVAEQCAWALGNVAGEGEDLRNVLLAQGALLPLARLMMSNKGSTAKTAAWALSNLIKGPDSMAATELIRVNGVLDAIIRHLRESNDEMAIEVAWVVVYLSALSETAVGLLVKTDISQLLVERLIASECLQLLIPVLRSFGNLIAADSYMVTHFLIVGHNITDQVISALVKCLKCEHRVLKKEAAWVLSNIAAGSIDHKKLIFSSEAMPLLIHLLSTAPFDIRKEVAYTLGNLCVSPAEGSRQPNIILDHLVSLVKHGCLPGFINLVRSADIQAARLGLQFLEIVLRGMPDGEGQKLVEREDGIDAMERFQFHENEEMRNMANSLVDKYFGEEYGLDD